MSITWTIAIDWDRNGDFSGANEDVVRIQSYDEKHNAHALDGLD